MVTTSRAWSALAIVRERRRPTTLGVAVARPYDLWRASWSSSDPAATYLSTSRERASSTARRSALEDSHSHVQAMDVRNTQGGNSSTEILKSTAPPTELGHLTVMRYL